MVRDGNMDKNNVIKISRQLSLEQIIIDQKQLENVTISTIWVVY